MSAGVSPIPTPPPVAHHPATTVIQPTHGIGRLRLAEIWHYRDLLMLLTMRDVRVRYKQAALGIGWAVLQPVAMAGVLYLFFGVLMGLDEKVAPVPYLVFVLAGVLPWTMFESAVTAASGSVVANAAIVRKVYFPRLIVPLSAAGAPLVDYAIGLGVLLVAMLILGAAWSWQLVLLPLMILSVLTAVLGIGVLLAALTVSYRDFRHLVPFMLRLLFFMTPVIYPVTLLPDALRWLIALNPVGGTISAFRAAVLGTPIDYTAWGVSTLTGLVALALGVTWFQRAERRFADVV
ncbi:MAG: ABC transporter permease [Planctomycetota bacterium]